MKQYKNFVGHDSRYTMKRRYGFAAVISIALALCAIGGYAAGLPAVTWIFGILAPLALLSIWTESLVIDTAQKEIVITKGLIARKAIVPFAGILHFEVLKITHYLIPVNTSLNVWYVKEGKEKVAMVGNSITTRAMQNLLNEIEEIIKNA